MTDGHVFGSGDLRPELVRAVRFAETPGGGLDPAQVHAFLENIATALEVLASTDEEQALRAEFRRNAEIAQQVLDAGQAASEQLRRHAAEDARRILEETRTSAVQLQEAVRSEIEASRSQVDDVRAQFISDLRDLYDRIGASLYRFERAAAEGPSGGIPPAPGPMPPIAEPAPAPAGLGEASAAPDLQTEQSAASPPPAAAPEFGDLTPPAAEMPEGAMPPAFSQLPPAAYVSPQGYVPEADPFAVHEDEPLAPGEPLVDMRELHADAPAGAAAHEPSHAAHPHDDSIEVDAPSGFKPPEWMDTPIAAPGTYVAIDEQVGGPAPLTSAEPTDAGWLGASDEGGATAAAVVDEAAAASGWLEPDPAAATTTNPNQAASPDPAPVAADVATPDPATDATGSWLDDPAVTAAASADPIADDARAEELLASMGQVLEEDGAHRGDAPTVDSFPAAEQPAPPPAMASPDAMAIRQLILESISQGQSRETVEAYLRDQMGFVEPGALVDAALQSGGQ